MRGSKQWAIGLLRLGAPMYTRIPLSCLLMYHHQFFSYPCLNVSHTCLELVPSFFLSPPSHPFSFLLLWYPVALNFRSLGALLGLSIYGYYIATWMHKTELRWLSLAQTWHSVLEKPLFKSILTSQDTWLLAIRASGWSDCVLIYLTDVEVDCRFRLAYRGCSIHRYRLGIRLCNCFGYIKVLYSS